MPLKQQNQTIFIVLLFSQAIYFETKAGFPECEGTARRSFNFKLVKRESRAKTKVVDYENVETLKECSDLAINVMGLAFNYSPETTLGNVNLFKRISSKSSKHSLKYKRKEILEPSFFNFSIDYTINNLKNRKKLHYFDQLEEYYNCIILECPENLVSENFQEDSRFDYYSLYDSAIGDINQN